uniref:Ovule protein n=1 Tax=Ascaris lumbricoides TaxID=6252 RepID=A0A0M3HQU4_ASCLU
MARRVKRLQETMNVMVETDRRFNTFRFFKFLEEACRKANDELLSMRLHGCFCLHGGFTSGISASERTGFVKLI